MNFAELVKSKTFWTAMSGIVVTMGSVAQGALRWQDAILPILTALIGVFLKDALVAQTKTLQPPPQS